MKRPALLPVLAVLLVVAVVPMFGYLKLGTRVDRKSTRLNSSH